MALITNQAQKVAHNNPEKRAKAVASVSAYLDDNDPYLDSDVNRKLISILSKKTSSEAARLLARMKPRVLPSLRDLLEDENKPPIDEKELLEASCFYHQVSRVLHSLNFSVDYLVDWCAGNCLTGTTWLLEESLDHVYFADNNNQTRASINVRRALELKGYGENFLISTPDLMDRKVTEEYLSQLYKKHYNKTGLIVGIHACGNLTDALISHALKISMPFAVTTCCHRKGMEAYSPLSGEIMEEFAPYFPSTRDFVDTLRIVAVQQEGYIVKLRSLPKKVSQESRIIIGIPIN